MEIIESQSKKYEEISQKYKKNYQKTLDSIPIIKQFIIDNKLIIYGGTAIDYALRLLGDNIYPDESLTIPDLDFYSPEHVKHAYNLADILFKLGYNEVRTIRATYVQTMRVDIFDNTFVADITYIYPDIFNKLPILEYEGMKIIHPNFQFIDLHRSLSFPFENAPLEVIFARWKKDIERFNKLYALYPIKLIDQKINNLKFSNIICDIKYFTSVNKTICTGLSAYALLYKALKDLEKLVNKSGNNIKLDYSNIIPSNFEINNKSITITGISSQLNDMLEFIDCNSEQEANNKEKKLETNKPKIEKYNAYMSIMPKYTIISDKTAAGIIKIKTYSTKHKLTACNICTIDDGKIKYNIKHVNAQVLLFMLLSNSYIDIENSEIYRAYYISILKMIELAENLFNILSKKISIDKLNELISKCPLFPSIDTYGIINKNESSEILEHGALVELKKAEPLYLPINYYPERKAKHAEFNYSLSKYFQKNGLKIIN